MTDTHGSTPGNGPVPPTQGDEHAQHAAPMGQQPYYQQQQQQDAGYSQPQSRPHVDEKDVIDAEYTEREIK